VEKETKPEKTTLIVSKCTSHDISLIFKTRRNLRQQHKLNQNINVF